MTMLSCRVIRLADGVHGVLEEAYKLKSNLSAVLTEALWENKALSAKRVRIVHTRCGVNALFNQKNAFEFNMLSDE